MVIYFLFGIEISGTLIVKAFRAGQQTDFRQSSRVAHMAVYGFHQAAHAYASCGGKRCLMCDSDTTLMLSKVSVKLRFADTTGEKGAYQSSVISSIRVGMDHKASRPKSMSFMHLLTASDPLGKDLRPLQCVVTQTETHRHRDKRLWTSLSLFSNQGQKLSMRQVPRGVRYDISIHTHR